MYALPKDYDKPIKCGKGKIQGYLYFYDPQHPLAIGIGCVYLHRHEASLKIGRWVTSSETVHHRDENKLNNKHDNLKITTEHNHSLHHAIKRGGIPKQLKTCPMCSEYFLGTHQRVHCSHKCYALAKRRTEWPSKLELKQEIETMTWVALGRKYNVSDNAVRKWARKYGLL